MKIARISTNGFVGLPDRSFDLTDPASGAPLDRVVVTGGPGSGKTSFLKAIAAAKEDVAPYAGRGATARFVRPGAAAAKIKIDWHLSEAERGRLGLSRPELSSESILGPGIPPSRAHDPRLVALLGAYDHSPETGKFELFHADRTLARGAVGSNAIDTFDQRLLRLGDDLRKYSALPRFLIELCIDQPDGARVFQEVFGALCATKRFGGLKRVGRARTPFFVTPDGVEVEIDDLASSEQQAVIFAGTALLIGLSSSVALVDTPEKHLACSEVVPFALALSSLGNDNQLILATGSQELASAAPPQNVIRLGS
jgi:hypothetical protein